jgi:hypothetical protein
MTKESYDTYITSTVNSRSEDNGTAVVNDTWNYRLVLVARLVLRGSGTFTRKTVGMPSSLYRERCLEPTSLNPRSLSRNGKSKIWYIRCIVVFGYHIENRVPLPPPNRHVKIKIPTPQPPSHTPRTVSSSCPSRGLTRSSPTHVHVYHISP